MADAGAPCSDVVIVGAGPVGLTLANLLGLEGVSTVVFERNADLYDHPRAVGIDSDALRVWQMAALEAQLLPDMLPMGPGGLGMVYRDRSGRRFMEVRPARRPHGFAFGYGLIQPLVDRVLLAGLERFPCVDIRFGHGVVGLRQDADGVSVDVDAGGPGLASWRCRYLVACDGGSSGVRDALGIPMPGSSYRQGWLVLDTLVRGATPGLPQDVEILCDPDQPSVSVPRRGGHRRFEFLLRAGETPEQALRPERVRELLARFVDPRQVEVIRQVHHVFQARVAERLRVGRVLLAGDAAHRMPPFAAQGLATGVRDAGNLAWKLAQVLRSGACPTLLDTYEQERRPHALATVRLGLRLGRLMMPRSRREADLVAAAVAALLRLPPLRRFVREAGPRRDARYRHGFRLGGASRVGRMLAQPDVLDHEGRRRRLDDVLGPGFALLGLDVNPASLLMPFERRAWSRRGTRCITLRPPGVAARGPEEVQDEGGVLLRARARPRVLLVRPDRFVALDVAPRRLAWALQTLEQRHLAPPDPSAGVLAAERALSAP